MITSHSQIFCTSAQQPLERQLTGVEVFAPKEAHCNYCWASLEVYKTTDIRTVWTLKGPRQIREKWMRCSNESCSTREGNRESCNTSSAIVKSNELTKIAWPNMQYGIDVVLEVGQLYMRNRWNGKRICQELNRNYGLAISVSTVYRYITLYEALNKAIQIEHNDSIAKRIQEQLLFIIIVDAIQLKGRTRLYRAIDYLSGYCLGTLLMPEGGKASIKQWLENIIHMYGRPDYIISDGEENLHQPLEGGEPIPHGDCWWHVLHNIYDELLNAWRGKARRFLQKHRYRKHFNIIRLELVGQVLSPGPKHGQAVKALLDLFLSSPPGRRDFSEPMGELLDQFKEATILINKWDRVLKAQHEYTGEFPAQLEELFGLKQQFTWEERRNWYEQPFFHKDPFFQAFRKIHSLLNTIVHDKQFLSLVKEYRSLSKEFLYLRTWLDETQLFQWENLLQQEAKLQIQLPPHIRKCIASKITRTRKFLSSIHNSYRTWQRHQPKPDLSFNQQACSLLDGIIARWKYYGKKNRCYRRAANILERYYTRLLTFLEHPLIPATNQAIETDNGLLKQIWRQSSGCQDKAYMLDYHGDGLSATRNCHANLSSKSPLDLLGFSSETITEWYYTCSYSTIQIVQASFEKTREPRRQRLRIRRQGLVNILTWTTDAWLIWILDQVRLCAVSIQK